MSNNHDKCATCGHLRASHSDVRGCTVKADTDDLTECVCGEFREADEPAVEYRFGGSNEDGLVCGCQRRVSTPFCPWCGKKMDDAPAQLVAYLDSLVAQNEKSADTKDAQSDRYPGERRARTAKRLRDRAAQQRTWIAWVKDAQETLAKLVALDGSDSPPEPWKVTLDEAARLSGAVRK